ncbi:MAG: hypothetical protein ISN64_02075 [Rickettsia sp.]|nr:hypothetical protein [Rickettsia sp.]
MVSRKLLNKCKKNNSLQSEDKFQILSNKNKILLEIYYKSLEIKSHINSVIQKPPDYTTEQNIFETIKDASKNLVNLENFVSLMLISIVKKETSISFIEYLFHKKIHKTISQDEENTDLTILKDILKDKITNILSQKVTTKSFLLKQPVLNILSQKVTTKSFLLKQSDLELRDIIRNRS